ncbi:four helix bundle protein [bacterium]|nr:four helix bundle protein [bacterium]
MKHQELEVWNRSMELVTNIYLITKDFPKEELYGLVSQMRRCAVSIPSNIAEGCSRFSDKETLKFLNIALGSISELETQVIISKNIGYINDIENLQMQNETVKKLLLGLIRYLNTKTEQIE